jgi:hypothetical protein
VLLASASRDGTTTVNCQSCALGGGPAAIFILEVTDLEGGTGSIQAFFYYLKADGTRFTAPFAQSSAVSTVTVDSLAMCTTTAAGTLGVTAIEAACMPPSWEIIVLHADAQPITYSLTVNYLEKTHP